MAKKLIVIAGEASGDLHGANLIHALRAEDPTLEIHGIGGDRIRQTGALSFRDIAHFHVTGITDALKRLPDYRRAGRDILADVRRVRPHAAVLIDNPGFNLHLADKMKELGIPVIYYIAPQIWAWAPKRIFRMKKSISKVLVVFEFEKRFYEEKNIPVEWVGHPLKDILHEAEVPVTGKGPRSIVLMPGSRKGELNMLLEAFLGACAILRQKFPNTAFKLIKAPTFSKEFYQKRLIRHPYVTLVEENAYEVMRSGSAALVCSGTATLECAILGLPHVIAYKGTLLTYLIAKMLIRVPFLGLPNLVLGKKKIPELLQFDATPEKLADITEKILEDEDFRDSMKKDLAEVSHRLGDSGAAHRAAKAVLRTLNSNPVR